jgi:hypothetical protein
MPPELIIGQAIADGLMKLAQLYQKGLSGIGKIAPKGFSAVQKGIEHLMFFSHPCVEKRNRLVKLVVGAIGRVPESWCSNSYGGGFPL